MITISDRRGDEIIALLSSYASQASKDTRELNTQRRAKLLIKYLKRKING